MAKYFIAYRGGREPASREEGGADSMEAALEIAKACPLLDIGGTLEVVEMKEM